MSLIGPGSCIGIMGAGQLGRMLALVARRLGYRVAVFGGGPDSPCGQVSDHCFDHDLDDHARLTEFAKLCDVVTYEFENIPATAADVVATHCPLRPGSQLLATAQNRYAEKTAFTSLGLPTPEFRLICGPEDLASAIAEFGPDLILKANTEGYDGRGQWRVDSTTDPTDLWTSAGINEAIVEQVVDFQFELSVVGGRFENGQQQLFPPFLNHHRNHILDVTVAHSPEITTEIRQSALELAASVLDHFDVVGVLCLELFLTTDGSLLINEIAPRPHNSGHLTIEASNCSQFELQLRTICDLPPVDLLVQPSAMANLLGQHLPEKWTSNSLTSLTSCGADLHLYGKPQARQNRKMGHITAVKDTSEAAEESVRQARTGLKE